MAALRMNDESSIPVSDPQRSEGTSEEPSTKALHTYILSFIAMLGVLLSLKQRAGMTSLFDTNHPIFVMLIVVLTVYGGALIGATYILEAHPNSNFGKFVSTLSLSFGALTFILELMILVPYLGSAALLIWLVWFVSFVAVYLYPYVKTLFTMFTSAVGGIVHACEKLIEYLKNMIIARRFTMKPDEEQSGLP